MNSSMVGNLNNNQGVSVIGMPPVDGRQLQAERVRQVSQEWKQLTLDQRQKYIEMAQDDFERYQNEKKRYKGEQSDRKLFIKKIDLRKKQLISKDREKQMIKDGYLKTESGKKGIMQHKPSSFAVFVKNNMEEIREAGGRVPKQFFVVASELWKQQKRQVMDANQDVATIVAAKLNSQVERIESPLKLAQEHPSFKPPIQIVGENNKPIQQIQGAKIPAGKGKQMIKLNGSCSASLVLPKSLKSSIISNKRVVPLNKAINKQTNMTAGEFLRQERELQLKNQKKRMKCLNGWTLFVQEQMEQYKKAQQESKRRNKNRPDYHLRSPHYLQQPLNQKSVLQKIAFTWKNLVSNQDKRRFKERAEEINNKRMEEEIEMDDDDTQENEGPEGDDPVDDWSNSSESNADAENTVDDLSSSGEGDGDLNGQGQQARCDSTQSDLEIESFDNEVESVGSAN